MSDKKAKVVPGLSQEQIQNLKVGQTLRLVRKCPVREYSFDGDVEITEIVAKYNRCWARLVKINKKGSMSNIHWGNPILVSFDELLVL